MQRCIWRSSWMALLPAVLLAASATAEEVTYAWPSQPTRGEAVNSNSSEILLVSATSCDGGYSCAGIDNCAGAGSYSCDGIYPAAGTYSCDGGYSGVGSYSCAGGYAENSSGCGQGSCCDVMSCDDCCGPLWTVEGGAIFFRRDRQNNVPLTNGATPLSVGDLAFDTYQAGGLVSIMKHQFWNTDLTFEATYFGLSESNSAVSSSTAFFTTPTTNFGPNDVNVNYQSNLHSTEFNLRRNCNGWFTALAGFRWIELSDNLSTNIGGIASHNINVNNHLFGGQIGGDVLLWSSCRFSVQWFGKAGIYSNFADQTTETAGIGGAVPALAASDNQIAFLGEMSLTGTYYLTDRWSVRGGYQVLWFDGIALAPDQLATSNIATGVATLDREANPIYHGFTVSGQFTW